ncbi:MAG: GxxExxY protein [Bacteroidetes bacterium]|nr:MAG: GxxExxY protein [Bacteroidota bacterium]
MSNYNYSKIPQELNTITGHIVSAAFNVHSALGPGLLEKVYEICLCHEIAKRGLEYERQTYIPITYDGLTFDEGLRLDIIVNNSVICEIKAIETVHPVWDAQILSHLKLTGCRVGLLINFNVPLMKNGIKRFVK